MSDEAMVEAAALLGMTPLELEELATFYDYIYRSPVGKYVIKVSVSRKKKVLKGKLSWNQLMILNLKRKRERFLKKPKNFPRISK